MSRRRKARRYYWDGLQFPTTAIPVPGNAFELIGTTAQEFMPGTLVRVRGHLSVASTDVSGTEVAMKLMYVEVNDAQTMSGDHSAIDTHEEDIAIRQLWTYHTMIRGATAGQPDDVVRIEVDVKSKLRLEPHGKKLLLLLVAAGTAGRASMAGYLRCCVMMDA